MRYTLWFTPTGIYYLGECDLRAIRFDGDVALFLSIVTRPEFELEPCRIFVCADDSKVF